MSEPEEMSGGVGIHRWSEMEGDRMSPSIARKAIHCDTMTLARLELDTGAVVPMHDHSNEQLSWVESGALRFVVGGEDGEEIVIRPGRVLHIPPGVPHSAEALEPTVSVDLFSPPRSDWMEDS